MEWRYLLDFNPNCTGWGQSWPCQLLHQIPDKIHIYRIFSKIPILAEAFFPPIFLNTWHDIKKWHFDVHFDIFCQKPSRDTTLPIPPFRSVLLLVQNPGTREKSPPAVVCIRCSASQHSSQFPVPGPCRNSGGRQILSQAQSLTLSNWTAGTAPFWAISWNHSALWHT